MIITMLNRSDEAREMYEKLQSHPTPRVSKKARQFIFSFQVTTNDVKYKTFSSSIVRSHIGWGGERNTLYKGVETSP